MSQPISSPERLYHYNLSPQYARTTDPSAYDNYPINSIVPRSSIARVPAPPQPSPFPAPTSTLLDRLQTLPILRAIPWREGQSLPPEKSTHSNRVQQRGATLLVTRGQVADFPCASCAAGNGRFAICVVHEDWFRGACACCLFTSKGNRCTLRRERSVSEGKGEGAGEHKGKKRKRKRKKLSEDEEKYDGMLLMEGHGTAHYIKGDKPVSPDLDSLLQAQIRDENELGNMWTQVEGYKTPYGGGLSMSNPKQPANVSSPRTAPMKKESQSSSTKPIDVASKSMQRQIFGMISGMQGGIDNLQKQLNSFKTMLGIDDDDAD